ncbi:MAG TPA: alpha/beta hydrolase [Polyangiaceae bacterium]|nr:alpha/beta hydrolase [Polyangiaceae bacterium]
MNLLEDVRFIDANGIRYATRFFTVEGVAVAEPRRTVLLLHGFLDSGATWDLVAPHLAAAGFEVVAPDLRGFGASGRIPAGGYYYFADYIADVAALVDALAPAELSIVGHSMGGGVATLFAGVFPERVKKLAVLEGLGPMNDPPDLAVDRARRWLADVARIDRTPRPLASLEDAVNRLAATHPRVDRAILETRAQKLTTRDAEGRLVWAYDPLHRTTSPTPFSAAAYASFLRAITAPTLFVGGGPNGWHPPDESERLAHIREVRRVDFPEAGHMMHWTRPDELAAALLEHLG